MPNLSFLAPFLESLAVNVMHFLLRVLLALLVLFVGMKLVKFFSRKFQNSRLYQKMVPSLATFISSVVKIALYALLIFGILSILGFETASFLALFTSGGVAISLAFQGAVSNLAGGIMLLLFHPYKVGDYIETADVAGTVKEINVLYTMITTVDNKQISVPNGNMTNTAVTNYSAETMRRVDMTFSVGYSTDIDTVKGILAEIMDAHPLILKTPAAETHLFQQNQSSLDFVVRAWVLPENYWAVYFDLNESVKKAFDEKGIEIPFPQLDVHVK